MPSKCQRFTCSLPSVGNCLRRALVRSRESRLGQVTNATSPFMKLMTLEELEGLVGISHERTRCESSPNLLSEQSHLGLRLKP